MYDQETKPDFNEDVDEASLDAEALEDVDATDVEAQMDLDESAEELDEVDTPSEADVVPTVKPTPKKAVKATTTRAAVPTGFITPVAWAKKLSERLSREAAERGEINPETEEIVVPPQQVYSYINQAKKAGDNAKYPIPYHSQGGRDNLLVETEVDTWWDEKEKRKAEKKAGGKVAKKAAAPAASTEEVVEAE